MIFINIQLTESAKEKILNYNQNNSPVKVKVTGFSWCGAKIGVVSEKQENNDKVYNVDGASIIVSEELEKEFSGLKIDYVSGWFKKDFEVIPQR